MPKARNKTLTELEGAVLTEIEHRNNRTAFQVRRAFETSPSSSWSGSAGAVYPAIKRLSAAGLIVAEPSSSKRGTRLLSLDVQGKLALEQWSSDAETACAIGVDPFRLRAGLWLALSGERRHSVATALRAAIQQELAKLEQRDDLDELENVGNKLAIEVQLLRLRWIERELGE